MSFIILIPFLLKDPEDMWTHWLLGQEGPWGADSWGWNCRCFPGELHPERAGASHQGPWGRGGFLPRVGALLTPVSSRVRTEASPVTSTDQKKVKSEATTTLGLIFVAQCRTNMTGTSLLSFFFFKPNKNLGVRVLSEDYFTCNKTYSLRSQDSCGTQITGERSQAQTGLWAQAPTEL